MKKKTVMMLAGVLAAAMILPGCQASQGLETDNIKITQYKGVEIDEVSKPEEVTDEDVESSIESSLQSWADSNPQEKLTDEQKKNVEYPDSDGKVKDGDTVDIDFVGKMDGKEFDGGSSEGYSLTIGSDSFIDGFEDSIIGHKAGDTFDWDGKFPDDYSSEDYAGKDVTFTITVNAIIQVPELNDYMVTQLSDSSKTVKEYKAEVKENLTEDRQSSYDSEVEDEAWNAVLENTEVTKYPEDEKKEQVEYWKDYYTQYIQAYYGVEDIEDYYESAGITEDDFNDQVETIAESAMKSKMAVEAIADKEGIKVDDDTYESELKKIVEENGFESVDALEEQYDEDLLKEEVLTRLVKAYVGEESIQKAAD